MHGAEAPRLALEVDVVGVADERGDDHEENTHTDRGRRRRSRAHDVEHERDDEGSDRNVGDRRMQRMAKPHAVQEVLEDRDRLIERAEDRDEELAQWIGPHTLGIEDPRDRAVEHAASLGTRRC